MPAGDAPETAVAAAHRPGPEGMLAARIDRAGGLTTLGDPEAAAPWWSFSKTLIAICTLRLAEAGRLALDAPLPGEAFTPRQLMRQEAGLGCYAGRADYHAAVARGEPPWDRDRLRRAAGPGAPSGEGWAYSNVGFMVLRAWVERIEGQPISRIVAARIVAPLGLRPPVWPDTAEALAEASSLPTGAYHPGWVAHGLAVGRAAEAAAILRGLIDGRLLGAEMFEQMQAIRWLGGPIPGRPWTRPGYALGLMAGEVSGAGRALGHSAGGPFSAGAVYAFPDLPDAPVVACFGPGADESSYEWAGLALAPDTRSLR